MVKYYLILFFHTYACVHIHVFEFPDAMNGSEDSLQESGLFFTLAGSGD